MRVALIVFCLSMGVAHAGERIDEFAHRAPLEFSPGEAIYQVELPLAVHQGARRADLGDLRVFNGAGEVVPHALRPVMSVPQEEPTREASIFPYRRAAGRAEIAGQSDVRIELRPGGAVVIDVHGKTVDAPAVGARPSAYFFDVGVTDKAMKALKLDWEPVESGFSGRVDVHASDDLRNWRAIASGAALLDLSMGGQRLELSRIEFPAVKARYLRLTWPQAQQMPAVRAARVEPVAVQPSRVRRTADREAQRGEKDGEYVVDLGAPLAVEKVQIDLPNQNTVSIIELSARTRQTDPWQRIDHATWYRLLHGGQEWRNPERAVAAPPARYWKLTVDSRGGGLGSGMPTLRVTWEPRLLVFVARGDGPFTLAVGHDKYGPAAFRAEALIPGAGEGKPLQIAPATLGALASSTAREQSGHTFGALVETVSGEQGRRWLLWSVLIVGVGILAVMAWRMARQLGNSERRD